MGLGQSFAAGWNLLTTDPGSFFGVLTSGSAENVPKAEVKQAAQATTDPSLFGTKFGAGLSQLTNDPVAFGGDLGQAVTEQIAKTLDPIPTWVKVAIVGGIIVLGIGAIAFATHEIRKV